MLDHLRERAADLLHAVSEATLITYGPADLQARVVPCEGRGLCLYVLVPATSDMLFNLDHRPEVVVTPHWQLRGGAQVLPPGKRPAELALLAMPEAAWSALLAITPERLHWLGDGVTRAAETLDLGP